jgi:hypothetical protein
VTLTTLCVRVHMTVKTVPARWVLPPKLRACRLPYSCTFDEKLFARPIDVHRVIELERSESRDRSVPASAVTRPVPVSRGVGACQPGMAECPVARLLLGYVWLCPRTARSGASRGTDSAPARGIRRLHHTHLSRLFAPTWHSRRHEHCRPHHSHCHPQRLCAMRDARATACRLLSGAAARRAISSQPPASTPPLGLIEAGGESARLAPHHTIDFLPGPLPPPVAGGGLPAADRFELLEGGILLPLLGGALRPAAVVPKPLEPLAAFADLGDPTRVCGVSIGAARAAIFCAASMAAWGWGWGRGWGRG